MLYRRAQFVDYEKIVVLQNKNLVSVRQGDLAGGFLATQHTPEHFQQMNESVCVVVCESANDIIGYLGSCYIDFFRQFPIAATMINRLSSTQYQGAPLDLSRTLFTNPVCIDQAYRGQGVYLELCRTIIPLFPAQYQFGITLVAAENKRSLAATTHLGFDVIDQFEVNGKYFYGMIIDLAEFAELQLIGRNSHGSTKRISSISQSS